MGSAELARFINQGMLFAVTLLCFPSSLSSPMRWPALMSPLDSVLAATGCHPGDYTGKVDVKLTAEMPARCAMPTVLLQLLDTLEANVPGAVRDIDTEFLHDLRVAVRRSRLAIKLCGDVLAARVAEASRGEFNWLGDVTTPSATWTSICSATTTWRPGWWRRHRPS